MTFVNGTVGLWPLSFTSAPGFMVPGLVAPDDSYAGVDLYALDRLPNEDQALAGNQAPAYHLNFAPASYEEPKARIGMPTERTSQLGLNWFDPQLALSLVMGVLKAPRVKPGNKADVKIEELQVARPDNPVVSDLPLFRTTRSWNFFSGHNDDVNPLQRAVASTLPNQIAEKLDKAIKQSEAKIKLIEATLRQLPTEISKLRSDFDKAKQELAILEGAKRLNHESVEDHEITAAKSKVERTERDLNKQQHRLNDLQQLYIKVVVSREKALFEAAVTLQEFLESGFVSALHQTPLANLWERLINRIQQDALKRQKLIESVAKKYLEVGHQLAVLQHKGSNYNAGLLGLWWGPKFILASMQYRDEKEKLLLHLLGFEPLSATIRVEKGQIYIILPSREDFLRAYYNLENKASEITVAAIDLWSSKTASEQAVFKNRPSSKNSLGVAFSRHGVSLANTILPEVAPHEQHHQSDAVIAKIVRPWDERVLALIDHYKIAVVNFFAEIEQVFWTETLALLVEDEKGLSQFPSVNFFGNTGYEPLVAFDEHDLRMKLGSEYSWNFVEEVFLPYYEDLRIFGINARNKIVAIINKLRELESLEIKEYPNNADNIRTRFLRIRSQIRGYLRLRGMNAVNYLPLLLKNLMPDHFDEDGIGFLYEDTEASLRNDLYYNGVFSTRDSRFSYFNLQKGSFIKYKDLNEPAAEFIVVRFGAHHFIKALNPGFWLFDTEMKAGKYYRIPKFEHSERAEINLRGLKWLFSFIAPD